MIPRCSCNLTHPNYGAHGWHWRPYGDHDIRRALLEEIEVRGGPHQITDTEREIIVKRLEDAATSGHYRGLPVAYERCPAYHSAARRAEDRRKATAALGSSTVGRTR